LYQQYFIISAVILGLFFQQSGWLSHDYGHHQVFKNRYINNIMLFLFGNILQGFSATWWKERHNAHHALTNILDNDPDVDNLPLFLWSQKELDKIPKDSFTFKLLQYQAYYFPIFLPFLRAIWLLQSFLFVRSFNETTTKAQQRRATIERIGIALHYIWYNIMIFYFIPSFPMIILYTLICEGVGGFCISSVVFF